MVCFNTHDSLNSHFIELSIAAFPIHCQPNMLFISLTYFHLFRKQDFGRRLKIQQKQTNEQQYFILLFPCLFLLYFFFLPEVLVPKQVRFDNYYMIKTNKLALHLIKGRFL